MGEVLQDDLPTSGDADTQQRRWVHFTA